MKKYGNKGLKPLVINKVNKFLSSPCGAQRVRFLFPVIASVTK